MSRAALVCVLAGLVLAGSAVGATQTGHEQKHSGVIVAVAPDAHTITMDEMGPWTGPQSKPIRRTVEFTGSTTIQLDSRSVKAAATDGWRGGFQASPLEATALHPGDFATVTTEESNGKLVAASIAVVRPSTAAAAE